MDSIKVSRFVYQYTNGGLVVTIDQDGNNQDRLNPTDCLNLFNFLFEHREKIFAAVHPDQYSKEWHEKNMN